MMAETISNIPVKTSVTRKPYGGFRFTIDIGTLNAWTFDLTNDEYEKFFGQMMEACNLIPTRFLRVPQTETKAAQASAPQPPPTGNGQVVLWQAIAKAVESLDSAEADWLCELLHERAVFGKKKYGGWLRVNNGRDALRDILEEALDGYMYTTRLWMETGSHDAEELQRAFLDALRLFRRISVRQKKTC